MRKSEVLHILLDQHRQVFVYHYLKILKMLKLYSLIDEDNYES